MSDDERLREIEAEFAHRDPSVRFLLDLSAAKDAENERLRADVRLLVGGRDRFGFVPTRRQREEAVQRLRSVVFTES